MQSSEHEDSLPMPVSASEAHAHSLEDDWDWNLSPIAQPLRYKEHPMLPASAPKGQAHIIEDDAIDYEGEDNYSYDYSPCDFIATFLHKLEKYPDALKDFFDPHVKFFKLVQEPKDKTEHCMMNFMIWRKADRVAVGFEVSENIMRANT